MLTLGQYDYDLLHYLVIIPFEIMTPPIMAAAVEAWTWIFRERPSLETNLMMEINSAWSSSIKFRKGMFSESLKLVALVLIPMAFVLTWYDYQLHGSILPSSGI